MTQVLVQLLIDGPEMSVFAAERVGFFAGFAEACEAEALAVDHLLAVLYEKGVEEVAVLRGRL